MELAVDRASARTELPRGSSAPREVSTEIEREREQHERHQIAQHAGEQKQHACEDPAAAVDEPAQERLFAVQRSDRIRAKRDPFVAQQIDAGEYRHDEPSPDRHARPACEADGCVQIEERESQYNHQHDESHGDSLAGAAIFVLTTMPDRASAQSLARALVEARLAACVSIGTPVESLYHWRGEIETAQETP